MSQKDKGSHRSIILLVPLRSLGLFRQPRISTEINYGKVTLESCCLDSA